MYLNISNRQRTVKSVYVLRIQVDNDNTEIQYRIIVIRGTRLFEVFVISGLE